MESSTAVPAHERATGLDDDRRPDRRSPPSGTATRPAIRHKRDGEWHDVTYAELGEIVSEVGRGLIDLGIEPGDRVAILCTTRPEWTYADFGDHDRRRRRRPDLPDELARGVRVGRRQLGVARDRLRGRRRRWRRSAPSRGDLPALETIIVDRPAR